jgi:hypothetical protein
MMLSKIERYKKVFYGMIVVVSVVCLIGLYEGVYVLWLFFVLGSWPWLLWF